jgi:hypothetical protein
MPIDAVLIMREGVEFHRLEVDQQRAGELALEYQSLIGSAWAALEAAGFDDEPADFFRVLWDLRDSR